MIIDNNITQIELDSLEASQSETEWNHVCDGIKKARNGNYPPDWWPKVKLSGLMDKVMAKWGETSDLKVTPSTRTIPSSVAETDPFIMEPCDVW